jgi:hypothetical protein
MVTKYLGFKHDFPPSREAPSIEIEKFIIRVDDNFEFNSD